MLEKQIPVTQKFNDVMTYVLGPFINGSGAKPMQCHLFSPSDLYHIVTSCDPGSEFFKFETVNDESVRERTAPKADKKNQIQRWGRHLFFCTQKTREVSKTIRQRCRIGIRYSISQFPAFDKVTPCAGLPIGKEEVLYWIRPLQVEILKTGISDGIFPLEIRSVFLLTFPNGTTGQAGYIDRMNTSSHFRRFHLYHDGKLEAAETYSDQRLMHDLFRTLMGQIVLAEMHPSLQQIFRSHIHHPPDLFDGVQKAATGQRLVNADNVLPFLSNRVRDESHLLPADIPRQLRIR